MLQLVYRSILRPCATLLMCFALAGCSLTGVDVVDLDFRGEWQLFAQHQTEPELNVRYFFSLTENENQAFTASTRQYLIDMPIGDGAINVSGRIIFDGNNIRIELNYPDSENGPEIARASFARKSQSSSLAVVDAISYEGESVGIVRPGGTILGYDTQIVLLEQVSQ